MIHQSSSCRPDLRVPIGCSARHHANRLFSALNQADPAALQEELHAIHQSTQTLSSTSFYEMESWDALLSVAARVKALRPDLLLTQAADEDERELEVLKSLLGHLARSSRA